MRSTTRIVCGLTLVTVPSIQYGGHFMMEILTDAVPQYALTAFQASMFRAGHAHAGALVVLALVALTLSEHARLGGVARLVVQLGFPIAALLVGGGFFAAAIGPGVTEPTPLVAILHAGVVTLAVSAVTLGIGLLRRPERAEAIR